LTNISIMSIIFFECILLPIGYVAVDQNKKTKKMKNRLPWVRTLAAIGAIETLGSGFVQASTILVGGDFNSSTVNGGFEEELDWVVTAAPFPGSGVTFAGNDPSVGVYEGSNALVFPNSIGDAQSVPISVGITVGNLIELTFYSKVSHVGVDGGFVFVIDIVSIDNPLESTRLTSSSNATIGSWTEFATTSPATFTSSGGVTLRIAGGTWLRGTTGAIDGVQVKNLSIPEPSSSLLLLLSSCIISCRKR